jgi:hypothetical protein
MSINTAECLRCGGSFTEECPPSRMPKYCSDACRGVKRLVKSSKPLAERFWPRVDKTDGCWLWTGRQLPRGYGHILGAQRKNVLTHRVSWELTYGPIPAGLDVLHRCDNPPCVRPDHLFLGTDADNIADRITKGRPRSKMTVAVVRQARELYRAGQPLAELAEAHGVSETAVRHAAMRITWRHIA